MVGKSYPPEFYSWVKNSKTRSIFERIAQETEEDYQSLIKILKSFNVEILRPDIPEDSSLLLDSVTNTYIPPPMTPRDYTGMFGDTLFLGPDVKVTDFYEKLRDNSWPKANTINIIKDLKALPKKIYSELINIHDPHLGSIINILPESYDIIHYDFFYNIKKNLSEKCNIIHSKTPTNINTAEITRVGKDIYANAETGQILKRYLNPKTSRINIIDVEGHADGIYCPVVPGLIISLRDISTYAKTFPDWEVVYLKDQSWDKVRPFLDLKRKNKGKWWIPGEEYNDDLIEVVDTWMSKWVGYVEETVFDVNMLVIDEKNVIVNNYNKLVFDALERYNVTPHICNFRHRYFWDGGLHCITSDLDREGEMKDYFPERG
jgi:hypothetical protein